MSAPDPEFTAEDKDEFVITDLDTPSKTGKNSRKITRWPQPPSLHVRTWMSIAIVIASALLVFTVLVSVLHVPQASKVAVQPVQINYPVSLSVVDGICYANAPNGVVTAFRVRDGSILWRYVGGAKGEELATVVDGIIYLFPNMAFDSLVTTVTINALRARDGTSLWSRTLPTDAPAAFQLTVVNRIVYIRSALERIDALRASDGTLLWHYTSQTPFITMPVVADAIVYTATQDGHFTALRASDGVLLWTYTSLNPPMPVPEVVAEGMVFLSLQDGSMDVLSADTGILRWQYKPQVTALKISPNLLVTGGVVYATTQDGHLFALQASDGFTIWSVVPFPADNTVLLNVIGGVVFVAAVVSGSVYALHTSSGSFIWQYPAKAGESIPITAVQGVVYLAAIANGANLLANITALRVSDGKLLWNFTPLTSYRQLLPVDGSDIVLIALQDGSVEALRASNGSLLWRRANNS